MKKLLFIYILILSFYTTTLYARQKDNFNIKVHLTELSLPADIKIAGKYEILNQQYGSSISSGTDATIRVEDHSSGIKIEGLGTFSAGIIIETANGFSIAGNEYYDDAIIVKYNDKAIIVNSLDIENYVLGVLPYEMSPSWPIEALKAQALAARTYAIYHYCKNQDEGRVFDVDNTTKYQVYKGKGMVNDSIKQAVSTTSDQVITYNKKVIGAFFHAICGGYTDSTKNVFGTDIPYLRGSACYYCKDKIETWTNQIHLDKVKQTFGFDVDKSKDVKITLAKYNQKVAKVRLTGGGKDVEIDSRVFRSKIGTSTIPSLGFSIKADGQMLYIIGTGKGHGVGMCQWGAYGMAERGLKYDSIIKQYYKLTTIISYKKLAKIEADT